MSKFQPAGVAETLRSSQKDEYYVKYLKNLSNEAVQRTVGVRHWLKWKEVCDAVTGLMYYMLTTASGFQTLGEEYVYIVQVDPSLKKLPSAKRRFIYVVLQALGPVFLLHFQRSIEKKLQDAISNQSSLSGKRMASLKFLEVISIACQCMSYIQRLHLVLFYFNGAFYHVSKRLTGIRYVMLRKWLGQLNSNKFYKLLGCITAFQLGVSLVLGIQQYLKIREKLASESSSCTSCVPSEPVASKNQCPLCMEKSKDSTLLPCGHVFCWTCITNWLQNKEECPLCREKCGPSRLVYLQNYV